MSKSKGKTCMVKEPSHVKQLSLNHLCKTGLNMSWTRVFEQMAGKANMHWTCVCGKRRESKTSAKHMFAKKKEGKSNICKTLFVEK